MPWHDHDVVDLRVRPLVLDPRPYPARLHFRLPLCLVETLALAGDTPRPCDAKPYSADTLTVRAGGDLGLETPSVRREHSRACDQGEDALDPQLPVPVPGDLEALQGLAKDAPAPQELRLVRALRAGDVADDLARLERLCVQHDDARLQGLPDVVLAQDLEPLVLPDPWIDRLVEGLVGLDHRAAATLHAADGRGVVQLGPADPVAGPGELEGRVVEVQAVVAIAPALPIQVRDQPIVEGTLCRDHRVPFHQGHDLGGNPADCLRRHFVAILGDDRALDLKAELLAQPDLLEVVVHGVPSVSHPLLELGRVELRDQLVEHRAGLLSG
mmetsp:Transcript_32036/g.99840  ORF Transcript_32036/g.99840 Transcript_32036/m.99840 type:complete len:327 (-) Transcript_32036:90-1070(-)